MADVFLSYAREDRRHAEQIAQLLESAGWSVWWDRDLIPGARFDEVIEEHLIRAKCVVVVWTARAAVSDWVRNEASLAAEDKKLVPVLLEPVRLPLALRGLQAADFTNVSERDTQQLLLLRAVAARADRPPLDNTSQDDTRWRPDWSVETLRSTMSSRRLQINLDASSHLLDLKARYYYFVVTADGNTSHGTDMVERDARLALADGNTPRDVRVFVDASVINRINYVRVTVDGVIVYEEGENGRIL